MKNNYPWSKFYHNDWLNDGPLSMASPHTRGIWMDLIANMMRDFQNGVITGTIYQFAQLCRTAPEYMADAIEEIRDLKIADVTGDHEDFTAIVTVKSRRINREHNSKENSRLRKKRSRESQQSHSDDTVQKSEARSQKPEKKKEYTPKKYPPEFENLWACYKSKRSKGSKEAAYRSFLRINPDDGFIQVMLEAIGRHLLVDEGYMPDLSKWLNQEYWDADVRATASGEMVFTILKEGE